jgi:hypothetical protein
MRYLTTYIICNILRVCIKRRKKLRCSIVLDADMNGFPAILTKNLMYALTLNVIAHIGKNPVRKSKRGWSKMPEVRAMGVDSCKLLCKKGYEVLQC